MSTFSFAAVWWRRYVDDNRFRRSRPGSVFARFRGASTKSLQAEGGAVDTALRVGALYRTDPQSWINLQTHFDTVATR